jgi:thiol-disulfide isomerase/thioredoxin
MTKRLTLCALAALAATTAAARQEPVPAVELKPIKYDALIDLVKQNQGKVVVVDFWADFCIPCKREFPNLVRMARQYKDQGLVAVSVALDDPADEKAKARALKFLQAQRAAFTNVLLDEQPEVWQKKLDVDGPPVVYVFSRTGRLEKKFTGEVNYREVEELAVRLLKEK